MLRLCYCPVALSLATWHRAGLTACRRRHRAALFSLPLSLSLSLSPSLSLQISPRPSPLPSPPVVGDRRRRTSGPALASTHHTTRVGTSPSADRPSPPRRPAPAAASPPLVAALVSPSFRDRWGDQQAACNETRQSASQTCAWIPRKDL